MPDIPVPPEAVKAATDAIDNRDAAGGDWSMDYATELASAALAAAAPIIAAAERERIAALLDNWCRSCGEDDCSYCETRDQIAALIGGAE